MKRDDMARSFDQMMFAVCGGVATALVTLGVVGVFYRWQFGVVVALLAIGSVFWVLLALSRDGEWPE